MNASARNRTSGVTSAYVCLALMVILASPAAAHLATVTKVVEWTAVDDQSDTVKGRIDMELAGPAYLTKAGPDQYRLYVQFPPVRLAKHQSHSMYLSSIDSGSVSVAVDDNKAYFKPDSQKLYYTVSGTSYSIQQLGLGGTEYKPPQSPHPAATAIVTFVIGKVGIAGDILGAMDILKGISPSSNPVWGLNTYNWQHANLTSYDSSSQPQSVVDKAQPDNAFTDDAVNDIVTYCWSGLGGEAGLRESFSYWFELVRDNPNPTPLYLRVVIPYVWKKEWGLGLTSGLKKRWLEIEWKVDLPSAVVDTLSKDLIAHYALDGNASDDSGKGNHGTANGQLGYAQGLSGQCASFDGTNDYIDISKIADDINRSENTIAMWFKYASPGGCLYAQWHRHTIVCRDGKAGARVCVGSEDGGVSKCFSLSSAQSVQANTWHHVALTVKAGAKGVLYVDGAKVAEQAAATGLAFYQENFYLGSMKDFGARQYFKGALDEVRIYNRALSESEIQSLAKSPQ